MNNNFTEFIWFCSHTYTDPFSIINFDVCFRQAFYSKLLPLLKPLLEDRGLKDMKDADKIRKDWPFAALIAATKQLIAGNPTTLL